MKTFVALPSLEFASFLFFSEHDHSRPYSEFSFHYPLYPAQQKGFVLVFGPISREILPCYKALDREE